MTLNLQAAPAGIPATGDIPRAEQPQRLPVVPPATIKQKQKPAYEHTEASSALKITLQTFTFTGNQSFSSEALASLLAEFTEREIGIDALNQATKRITDYYRKNGYFLAQAYLPAQDIKAGSVQIAVIEGRLGQLDLRAGETLDQPFFAAMARYGMQQGSTVSEHNLVRNVTILNALPGVEATAQLNPSEAVGRTDVEISMDAQPRLQGYLGLNTYGNPFTKREVMIAGASWNNPAGRGDQLSLNLKRARDNGQRGLDFGYILPVHSSGTLLNLRYNYVDYKLGGVFKPLRAEGDSQYVEIGLAQPLLRDARKGLSVRVSSLYKEVNDEVRASGFENKRNVAAINVGLFGDWINANGDVSYQLGANIRSGRVTFKDSFAKLVDQTGAKTEGGFAKYGLNASRIQYFANGLSLAVRADYQRASKNLDTVEKISTGGINSWRAFAELPSLADSGYVVGTDLRKTIQANETLSNWWVVDMTPYGFIDIGRGKINQKALSSDNHVKSIHAGIGLDTTFKNDWRFSLTASHQNRDFSGADAENELRLWGQLIKFF